MYLLQGSFQNLQFYPSLV